MCKFVKMHENVNVNVNSETDRYGKRNGNRNGRRKRDTDECLDEGLPRVEDKQYKFVHVSENVAGNKTHIKNWDCEWEWNRDWDWNKDWQALEGRWTDEYGSRGALQMTQFTHNERCKLRLILCTIFPLAFAKCQMENEKKEMRCNLCALSLWPAIADSFQPVERIGEPHKCEISAPSSRPWHRTHTRTQPNGPPFCWQSRSTSLNKWIAISAAWLRRHFRWVL